MAVGNHCADVIAAAVVDGAAEVLTRLGDHPRAVRLLAPSERWRRGHPRPLPERAHAERADATARTALGIAWYTAEHTRGTHLTPADPLHALTEAVPDGHRLADRQAP
jgi:hypothetical protein